MDMANDLATILDVSILPGLERETAVVKNHRCFFDYALLVAAAYAVKLDRCLVLYEKDVTYAWH